MQATRAEILRAVETIIDAVAHAAPAAASDPWVPHTESPLGGRRTRDLVRSGAIPGHRVGKVILVRQSAMDAFIEAHAADGSCACAAPATPEATAEAEALAAYNAPPRRRRAA